MEWEDLARKQKGKKSKSYCVSNSTLKSVAEYCSEKKKKKVTLGWTNRCGTCKTHKINFTTFPVTEASAGTLDISFCLLKRATSIHLIDYFVFASQFEYVLNMRKLIFPGAGLTYLSATPA